jgi:hypothetical protein
MALAAVRKLSSGGGACGRHIVCMRRACGVHVYAHAVHMPCTGATSSRKGSECSFISPSSNGSAMVPAAMRAATSEMMIAGMIATSPPTLVRYGEGMWRGSGEGLAKM